MKEIFRMILEILKTWKKAGQNFKMFEGKEEKKCKGIKKAEVKKNITHENYNECNQKP